MNTRHQTVSVLLLALSCAIAPAMAAEDFRLSGNSVANEQDTRWVDTSAERVAAGFRPNDASVYFDERYGNYFTQELLGPGGVKTPEAQYSAAEKDLLGGANLGSKIISAWGPWGLDSNRFNVNFNGEFVEHYGPQFRLGYDEVFDNNTLTWKQKSVYLTCVLSGGDNYTGGYFYSPIELPSGSGLKSFVLYARDANSNFETRAELVRTCPASVGAGNYDSSFQVVASARTGTSSFSSDLKRISVATAGHTFSNQCAYAIRVSLGSSGDGVPYSFCDPSTQDQKFYYAQIRWAHQVSRAPTAASFSDVPKIHPNFRYIEALHRTGVTAAGCDPGKFCPNDTLTRSEFAEYMSQLFGLQWVGY